MKVLILTVTAGFGHHATAAAIETELKSMGAETCVVDVYKYISKFIYEAVDKGYLLSTKYASDVYRTAYTYLENKTAPPSSLSPVTLVNTLCALKFEKFLDAFSADAIICTHIFAAQILNELKARDKLPTPVIGVITDYTIHPYWEDVPHVEYVVIASDLLKFRAVKRGIPEKALLPFGIPIRPKFAHSTPKAEAREALSIPLEAKTILLMAGSMGYGHIDDLVKKIRAADPGYEILAVCGNNKRQYRTLLELNGGEAVHNGLHVFGFIDNVDLLMDAADCIVTKPGGLTVSEALAKMLPMVLVSPIPGQEERNIEFLLNNGMALLVTKTFELDEAIQYLFYHPERIELMKRSIEIVRKPYAGRDLAEFVLRLCGKESPRS